MKHVLLVDDEPNVLQALERTLQPMRDEWAMTFVTSGAEALAHLAAHPVDVIVTDTRMPGMDGARLLAEVAERHPEVVRIVLSGQCDEDATLRLVRLAHQYFAKPCETEMLRSAVNRACGLHKLLHSPALRQLITQMPSLPALPSLYVELMREFQLPHSSAASVAAVIARDVAMSAKVLQLVNSAFFGLPVRVTTPQRAVALLGMRVIRALVLSAGIFSCYEGKASGAFDLNAFEAHSLGTAVSARTIAAAEEETPEQADEAFLAGLLHDLGRLVLVGGLPGPYAEIVRAAREGTAPLWRAESEALGASHAEIGAYLAGLWGFPEPVIEALAFHHRPADCPHRQFGPLIAVHVADAVDNERRGPLDPYAQIDGDHLAAIGLLARVPVWRERCLAVQHQGSPT